MRLPPRADGDVFPSGNRNAASHRWATFLLDCASQLDGATLVSLFAGFCPISGSITGGGDAQRHIYPSSGWGALSALSTAASLSGGALYHCCPPCICDAVDFLGVDTKTVVDSSGSDTTYTFVVIGNPCGQRHAAHISGAAPLCVPAPLCRSSSVSQPLCLPAPLCPSPSVSQPLCLPAPLTAGS